MTEAEFWDTTPRFFAARWKAYEQSEQRAWERARFMSYFTVKTVDSKNRIKRFSDLIGFPWEKAKKSTMKPPTAEELAELEKFSKEADEIYLKMFNQQPQ